MQIQNSVLLLMISKFFIYLIFNYICFWFVFYSIFFKEKFLYINGWGFSENLGHNNSLQWPALIKSKNGFLKLSKQKKIYVDSFNLNHSVIPIKKQNKKYK